MNKFDIESVLFGFLGLPFILGLIFYGCIWFLEKVNSYFFSSPKIKSSEGEKNV